VIKTRRIRWAGHVARTGKVHTGGFGGETGRERDHLEDLGVDGSTILKYIFEKGDAEAWTGLIWLRIRTGGGRL
jgi:hypothetical protein